MGVTLTEDTANPPTEEFTYNVSVYLAYRAPAD